MIFKCEWFRSITELQLTIAVTWERATYRKWFSLNITLYLHEAYCYIFFAILNRCNEGSNSDPFSSPIVSYIFLSTYKKYCAESEPATDMKCSLHQNVDLQIIKKTLQSLGVKNLFQLNFFIFHRKRLAFIIQYERKIYQILFNKSQASHELVRSKSY